MLLLFAMLQDPPKQNFPEINRPGTFADLRGSVERACGVREHVDTSALLKRELDAAWDVRGWHVPADKWTALGCARGLLAGARVLAHDGPLMIAGNSWSQGGERAMQEVLKERPDDARAAEVLGLLALDDNDPDDLKAAATSLIAATENGVMSAGALRACAELALRTFAEAAARRCSETALRFGADSTWHLMRLAQLASRGADTGKVSRFFLAAAGSARDSLARQEVTWHLQWFLSPEELAAWGALADAARGPWLRDKMMIRDVRDGQPFGARLAEHFKRLEYVETHFRLAVNRRTRNAQLTGPNMDPGASNDNDIAVRSACEAGMILAQEWRFYPRWQTDFDDRGVVWMRFGEPDQRVHAEPSCRDGGPPQNTREVWVYHIDGERLMLNFEYEMYSGSVEATRLVEGVLGSYFCNVDQRRCNLTELSYAHAHAIAAAAGGFGAAPSSDFVHPEDILHLHQEDAKYISAATTKDDNSPRGGSDIEIYSRLHRLWDPVSSIPIALVTYALPVKQLAIAESEGKRSIVVRFELRQWDAKTDAASDTSFVRRFTVPDTNAKRPNVVGFVTVPSTPEVNAWSLVATQAEDRRGRSWDVNTPGLPGGAVVLSDLIVGAEAQNVIWNLHNVAIPLAPTGVLDRREPVSLYYQIRGSGAEPGLRTTVALYRVVDGTARDSATLQVSYDQAIRTGINEVAPTLDVSRLEKGSYSLEVRLTDVHGKVLASRRAPIELN